MRRDRTICIAPEHLADLFERRAEEVMRDADRRRERGMGSLAATALRASLLESGESRESASAILRLASLEGAGYAPVGAGVMASRSCVLTGPGHSRG